MLVDRFGRVATDLRVSLTDRCNLRCSYCMPPEGLPWLPGPELLTDDELVRLVAVAASEGVREVRFTGGEPLLRRGVVDLVARVAALRPRLRLSLTTNGIGLGRLAGPLAEAGLDRVNVSLDTLHPDRFVRLTRRDRLADVVAGLAAADAAGLRPVKVNTVLMRGVNEDEAVPLLRWCLERGYELRFIEQMPLDAQHGWRREDMVTADEILARLGDGFVLEPEPEALRGSAPAQTWRVVDGTTGGVVGGTTGGTDGGTAGGRRLSGRVGVIASVTRAFCGSCDRVRLTADGQLRSCLFAREESDLRASLRGGADDAQLAAQMRTALRGKRAGHGIDDPAFLQPDRPMSAIGG